MDGGRQIGALSGSWERDVRDGWSIYRHAVELLSRDERGTALQLLAEAEIVFRGGEDQQGLWRALAGQTAAHWQAGDATLALARASAALRAATTASDQLGMGIVAWQVAVLQLHLEDYRKAAFSLFQTQEAYSHTQGGAAGASIAACAQLCYEIDRWREMHASRLVAWRTATQVIAAIQRDLAEHLGQALATLRLVWEKANAIDDGELLLLVPGATTRPQLARLASAQPSLPTRLSRWWNTLIGGHQRLSPQPTAPPPLLELPQLVAQVEPRQAPVPPADQPATPAPPPSAAGQRARLAVSCFGRFRVALDDQPIERWESVRGRTIFKYLVTRRGAAVPKELLADMFWPESDPELARRSLHQAIYCLRQSFKRADPTLAVVLFNGDCYQINPELNIWVDSDDFSAAIAQARSHIASGQSAEATRSYALAADLAGGEFLEEDRYEPWAEELRQSYRSMLTEALRHLSSHAYERGDYATSLLFGQRLLALDSCDEEAHLTLMRCHVAQGLRHLAVRQYQICVNTLRAELGLGPCDEIESFYQQVVAVA